MPDTQQRGIDDAGREMERTADEMQEHGARVEQSTEDARDTLARSKSDDDVPTAEAWDEGDEPADDDEDPAGFDDPESLDLDDEDLEDDDGHADED